MKLCIVGDQHFRFQLPYAAALSDGRRGEWDAVIAQILETAKGCDAVVLLGDNLNSRHNHSSVNNAFMSFLKELSEEKRVFIIAGNHERYGSETAIDFVRNAGLENVSVFTRPEQVVWNDLRMTFLPYMTPGLLERENLEDAQAHLLENLGSGDILFHHHAVKGTKIHGQVADFLNEIVLPREELETKFKWVIGGHIHGRQWLSSQTLVTGSIFPQEAGDHDKAIYVLDTSQGVCEEVLLPVRGIYKLVNPSESDINAVPEHSIVKVVITSPEANFEGLRGLLERFDAHIVVEQIPSERKRVSMDETGALDLSIDNLLKVYSKERDVDHNELVEAFKEIE